MKYIQLLFGITTFGFIVTIVLTNNMMLMPWLMLFLALTCLLFSIDSLAHKEKALGWSLMIVTILALLVMWKGIIEY